MDDVLLNKVGTIERCLERIREEYRKAEGDLETVTSVEIQRKGRRLCIVDE